jgi:hypothetical protein
VKKFQKKPSTLTGMLKGQCQEIFIFDYWFSTWISFPQAPDYKSVPLGHFNFFHKFADIFATGVIDTSGKWKKSPVRKVFFISFGHLWVVELA